jgi:hypothetical protein
MHKLIDVSEDCTAFIFRVEGNTKQLAELFFLLPEEGHR